MTVVKFYDCNSIIHTKDKNGEDPALFFVVSRGRGVGKTFSFSKMMLERFFETGEKFALLCRTKGAVGSVAVGILSGAIAANWPEYSVRETRRQHGVYGVIELERYVESDVEGEEEIERIECGYVLALNAADEIKRTSSIFHDTVHAFFDEFLPESRQTYLPDEPEKFKSIHTSIARGIGSPQRHFPVYFAANAVTMDNPYFLAMGLHKQIQRETKRYRGDGFVYQRYESEEIAGLLDDSAVSRAMPNLQSSNFRSGAFFMDDDTAVEKPTQDWGMADYFCTLVHSGVKYGLFFFPEINRYYLSHKFDGEYPRVYRITLDGDANLPVIKKSAVGKVVRDAIYDGAISYQSNTCKNVAYDFLI